MRVKATIILGGIIAFIFAWGSSMLICEINTLLHKDKFIIPEDVTEWVGENGKIKILSYSKSYSRIYYYDDESGCIIEYIENNYSSRIMWARQGNAEDAVWPYFYHAPHGNAIAIILVFLYFIFCLVILAVPIKNKI